MGADGAVEASMHDEQATDDHLSPTPDTEVGIADARADRDTTEVPRDATVDASLDALFRPDGVSPDAMLADVAQADAQPVDAPTADVERDARSMQIDGSVTDVAGDLLGDLGEDRLSGAVDAVAMLDRPVAMTDVPESTMDVSVADVPVADVPVADVPVADVPVADVPVADVPVADLPVVSCATTPTLCDPNARCVGDGAAARCVCRCGFSGDGARCVDDYPTVLFVRTGGTGDGSCWAEALPTVQAALAAARAGTEIWVAAGTYVPGTFRMNSFRLRSGVALYGGFAGTETRRDQRNPTRNVTTLSGDLLGDDRFESYMSDNAFHVIDASNVTADTVVDGFDVRSGNANGVGTSQNGAAIYAVNSAVHVTNCRIANHYATVSTIEVSGVGALFEDVTLTLTAISGVGVRAAGGASTFRRTTALAAGAQVFSAATGATLEIDGATLAAASTYSSFGVGAGVGATLTLRNASLSGFSFAVYSNGANVTIQGCTLSNNHVNSSSTEGGGAVYATGGGVTITDSTFRNNTAADLHAGRAGAVYLSRTSPAVVERCTFEANWASIGAAIGAVGDLRVVGSTFRNHTGISLGMINVSGGTLDLRDARLEDNSGPAVHISEGRATVTNSVFSRNVGTAAAGAIDMALHATLQVVRSTFVGNRSTTYGGAISYTRDIGVSGPLPAEVVSCRFVGNQAASRGGAISFGTYGSVYSEQFRVINSEFIGNSAGTSEGAIALMGANLVVTQSSFFNNTSPSGPHVVSTVPRGSTLTAANSVFWTDGASVALPTGATVRSCAGVALPAGAGNITLAASPFAYSVGADGLANTADDSLPLASSSACVGHGVLAELPADTWDVDQDGDTSEPLPLDVRGAPRVQGSALDMGANEQ